MCVCYHYFLRFKIYVNSAIKTDLFVLLLFLLYCIRSDWIYCISTAIYSAYSIYPAERECYRCIEILFVFVFVAVMIVFAVEFRWKSPEKYSAYEIVWNYFNCHWSQEEKRNAVIKRRRDIQYKYQMSKVLLNCPQQILWFISLFWWRFFLSFDRCVYDSLFSKQIKKIEIKKEP